MIELTRTLHQWRTIVRRLELGTIGRPDLAEQIRWALPADQRTPAHTPLTVSVLEADGALIERLLSVGGRRGPANPSGGWPPHSALGSPAEAVVAAEVIIRDHQRRRPTTEE